MFCDPDKPDVCLICEFGSYMDKSGTCIYDDSLNEVIATNYSELMIVISVITIIFIN